MKHGRLADFFFVGLAIVPAALAFGGLLHLAILLFVPMLFIACVFGMAEQVAQPQPKSGGPRGEMESSPREASGHALRARSSPDRPSGV